MRPNRWTIYDYLYVGLSGFPSKGLMSIDVTYRCNLHCAHCYFNQQNYTSELSIEEWMVKLEEMKLQGVPLYICGWLGGEPLLRPEVIERGKKFFKSNIIFTNGTRELPQWSDCTFVVSVPGTKAFYQEITGSDSRTYDFVKEHANRSDLHVVVSFCITRQNVSSIEDFLSEWQRVTGIQGVFFEFQTPQINDGEKYCLESFEKDSTLDTLIELKKSYGDFIYNTFQMLELMKSKSLREMLSSCPFSHFGLSLDPMGQKKFPCALGPEADCERCGCILPVFSLLLWRKRLLIRAFAEGIKRELHERRKLRTKSC